MKARTLAFALTFVILGAAAAHAQALIGGGGGLGIFQSAWTYFRGNALEGVIILGVAALGVMLLMMHFHVKQIAMICAGAAILANAVAIGAGIVTIGG